MPAAKKNSRLLRAFGRRSRPNAKAVSHQDILHMEAIALARRAGFRLPAIPHGHRVQVRLRHLVGERDGVDQVEIETWDLGPWPAGHRRGNREDLDNMIQVVLDAFQGALYANDNQITNLILVREAAHQ